MAMAKKVLSVAIILFIATIFVCSSWLLLTPRWAYQVTIGGKQVGVVDSLEDYRQIVEAVQACAEEYWGCGLIMNEETAATRFRCWTPQSCPASVQAGIEDIATYQTKGWAIVINGETVAIVDKEETAVALLEAVQTQYITEASNRELISVTLQEAVSIDCVAVTPETLADWDTTLALLTCGQEELNTYVVKKGDTLSEISRSHGITLSALREANSISGDFIQIGQILSLQTSKALLHVKTVEEVSANETISRPVTYKINPDPTVRADTVVESGFDGNRKVVYQVVKVNGAEIGRKQLRSTVTQEPKAKVILTGIGFWPAKPLGMFRFPVNGGKITSLFGAYRSHGSHKGVDIANSRGTPIYAAADGVVTAKGWSGGYGRCIVIRHSDGYSTLYGHLSSLSDGVRVGGSVRKGQYIGGMGSTGNSTGCHLHWEVRRNGVALNPLQFFQ